MYDGSRSSSGRTPVKEGNHSRPYRRSRECVAIESADLAALSTANPSLSDLVIVQFRFAHVAGARFALITNFGIESALPGAVHRWEHLEDGLSTHRGLRYLTCRRYAGTA